MKITNIEEAVKTFKNFAEIQGEATLESNYKVGNKYYDKLVAVFEYLKVKDEIDVILNFVNDKNSNVRLFAACFLLFKYEKLAISILKDVAKENSIIGHNAEMTLSEWKKGNLKSYWG